MSVRKSTFTLVEGHFATGEAPPPPSPPTPLSLSASLRRLLEREFGAGALNGLSSDVEMLARNIARNAGLRGHTGNVACGAQGGGDDLPLEAPRVPPPAPL